MSNVFKSRNFRLVFLGALVSDLGAVLYSFAVSFYILEITNNNAFLQGLYLALCGAVLLILTPVGGVLGDRFNKARIMFLCDYAKGGLILIATVLMLLLPAKSAHVVILFVIGILGNAVSGIFAPAAGAIFPHIVEENQLQQANAYFSLKSSLQSILGVILAGILYALLPIQLLFLFIGLCYVASGVSEMFIRYAYGPSEENLTLHLMFTDMKDGLDYLRSQKALLALMGSILFINFFMSPVSGNFMPYFIKTDVQGSASYLFDRFLTPELWSSVFGMIFGLSSLVTSAILSARPQKEKCGHTTALWLLAIAGVMIELTLSYWVLVSHSVSLNTFIILFNVDLIIIGFLIPLINIPASTVLMRIVDKDKLSKVGSIVNVCSQGLIPIASVLAGGLLQYMGSTVLLAFCTVGFTVTALLLLSNKKVKEI